MRWRVNRDFKFLGVGSKRLKGETLARIMFYIFKKEERNYEMWPRGDDVKHAGCAPHDQCKMTYFSEADKKR